MTRLNLRSGSKIEAIRKYCEFYYRESDWPASALPDRLRFVETPHMNEPEYQSGVLSFVGISPEDQVYSVTHINQSEPEGRQQTVRASTRPEHTGS